MPKFYGAIDLVKNELQNAAIQNLGAAPSSPVKGQLYLNTTDNTLYYWDGTVWQAMKSGTGGPPTGPAGGDLSGTYPNPTVVKSAGDFTVGADLYLPPSGGQLSFNAPPISGGSRIQMPSNGNTSTDGISFGDGGTIYRAGSQGLAIGPGTGGYVNLNSARMTNVGDPTGVTDATNKQYVDNLVQGLSWKTACRVATTVNLAALSGLIAVDGVTVVFGDRVLVKNQTTASANGIYVAQSGAWTRAGDMDTAAEFPNAATFVSEGSTQADTMWQQTANAPITIGTTNITWVQVGSAASYIGGAGLTLTGNTFDVGAGTGITVAADSVAVDSTVVALKSDLATYTKKYTAALTGTVAYATGEVVTHNLNTRDVQVTVINGASPYNAVEVDWEATSVNTITLRYNPNLGAGYRVVVTG